MNIMSMLEEQKGILESQGHKVAYICVYGSQNYGLDINNDEYQSDVDMKAIVVPTLDNLIANSKPTSLVLDTEYGQIDVKDIRNYFETLLKANPSYVETLYTKYYIIDKDFASEMGQVLAMRDDLVHTLRAQFVRAMYGMMLEKEKALTHPYPSIIHKIEKYGYDGKQAHHIKRLQLMMDDYYTHGKPLSECFIPEEDRIELLMDLKLNKLELEDVKHFVQQTMAYSKHLKDFILERIDESTIDYSIKDKFLNLSQQIIKNKIINEIQSGK